MFAVTPIWMPRRASCGTLLKFCPAREVLMVWLTEEVVVYLLVIGALTRAPPLVT